MATLAPEPYYLPAIDWTRGRVCPHQAAFDELCAEADALPADEYVGGLIKWQVADGYAHYRVVSLSPSVVLQHVPFLDGYAVAPETIRGLRRKDVEAKVDAERRLRAAFSGSALRVRGL
jgi:hypothetical protein